MKNILKTLFLAVVLVIAGATQASAFAYNQTAIPLNTVFQGFESLDNIDASVSVQIASTLTISGGQTGTVFFEISADGSSDWIELARVSNGNTGTLAIGLSLTDTKIMQLRAVIPQTMYARLRTSGTATITVISSLQLDHL